MVLLLVVSLCAVGRLGGGSKVVSFPRKLKFVSKRARLLLSAVDGSSTGIPNTSVRAAWCDYALPQLPPLLLLRLLLLLFMLLLMTTLLLLRLLLLSLQALHLRLLGLGILLGIEAIYSQIRMVSFCFVFIHPFA